MLSLKPSAAESNVALCGRGSEMAILGSGEHLKNDIWPRSVVLWMAALYVALFIIRPWEQLVPWLSTIRFERIYALCMIAAVFSYPKKQLPRSFQTAAVILFFLGIGVSALFAWNSSLAWAPFYEYMTLLIFYFILLLVVRTPYELMFLVACYLVAMAMYLTKSQWEYFVHGQHRYDMGVYRMVGIETTFGGPNSLAMSIVVSLPFCLFLYSVRKEFCQKWPAFWRKWLSKGPAIYLALAVSSIALTNSRSGMLSFVLFVFLVTFRGKGVGRKLGNIIIGVLILLLLWQVLPQEKKGRFRSIWDPSAAPPNATVSAQGRKEGFRAGMTMFKRFPITGVGIGNFGEYRLLHVDGTALEAHNLAGQALGEMGLVGGATFLLMVIVTLANCRKVRVLAKGRSDPTVKILSGLALACRDAIILLAFEGFFGHNVRRFNWLWLAAFGVLALQYARQRFQEMGAGR